MFLEQITNELKTEYRSFGLSNEAIGRIASVIEKTVTKEEEIGAAVKGAETMTLVAKEVMKMRDGEIQKRTDLQKSYDDYKAKNPIQEPPTEPKPDENEKLLARIEALEKANMEKDKKAARDAKIAEVRAKMTASGADNGNILDLVLEKAEIGDAGSHRRETETGIRFQFREVLRGRPRSAQPPYGPARLQWGRGRRFRQGTAHGREAPGEGSLTHNQTIKKQSR